MSKLSSRQGKKPSEDQDEGEEVEEGTLRFELGAIVAEAEDPVAVGLALSSSNPPFD